MLLVRHYPLPDNEVTRASEVKRYDNADKVLEGVFDCATQLCVRLFQAEISLISFIGDDTQTVKASSGLDTVEIPRSHSLCSHAILSNDVMTILDTAADMRFKANPFVVGAPFIRFYAGVPLKTAKGFNIGALCIADSQPRSCFSGASRGQLDQIAKVISSRLDEIILGPGSRSEPRHSIEITGMISSYGKKPKVAAIQNISNRGAMVHIADLAMPRGEEVVLSIGTIAIVATVMWGKDGSNGLSFHRPISDTDLATIKRVSRRAGGAGERRAPAT